MTSRAFTVRSACIIAVLMASFATVHAQLGRAFRGLGDGIADVGRRIGG